jgi:hypothetical protein
MVTKTRSFSTSPASQWLRLRRTLVFPIGATWAFLLGLNAEDAWPVWVVLATLVVLMAAELASIPGPFTHRRQRRTLRALHAALPWLDADIGTWVRPERTGELRTVLANLDVTVHELDGAAIRSVDELVTAVAARFGARTLPADRVERALLTLSSLPGRSSRMHAVVWNDADRFAAADPAAMHALLSKWRLWLPPHVLLFLVAPAPVAASAASAAAHARPPVEPDVALLAAAPSRAWWRLRLGDQA